MKPAATKPADTIPTGAEEMRKFLKRAQRGDASTLPVLRKMLENPATVDQFGGDLARQAALSLINAAAGEDLAFKEALTRKLELLRAELSGPNPTPLERLLVERIVACWLQVQDADVRYAQAKSLSLEWGDYYQRRMDRAHKRYLTAIKTLATVRKLALPVLQVNIARKQVNVAGPCPAPQSEKALLHIPTAGEALGSISRPD
jgi:hypothetical protein